MCTCRACSVIQLFSTSSKLAGLLSASAIFKSFTHDHNKNKIQENSTS